MSVKSSGWLPQLDGLRGISILMVLTAHVYAPGWPHLQGRLGVTVFFVLSGFLITRLLAREESEQGMISLAPFYVRRAFRLFPLYYLVLAVYCFLILGMGMHSDARSSFLGALPWYLTYMQDIPLFRDWNLAVPISTPFGQSWSLGIEEKFYLLWPIVAFRVLKNPRARVALAAAAVVFFSAAKFVSEGRYIYPYAAIAWGCLFALLYELPAIRDRLQRLVTSWRAPVALFTWPILQFLVAYTGLPDWLRLTAEFAYPLSICFVILASLRSVSLTRILSFAPLVILGQYSYCIYLIHLLVRPAAERALQRIGMGENGIAIYLLMLFLSAASAAVLHYAVESPFREMGRRIARSWGRKARTSAAASPAALDTAM